MAYKDLRQFLTKLESEGELLKIKEEVDWNEEIGAVSKRLVDRETRGVNAPAVLDLPPLDDTNYNLAKGGKKWSGKNILPSKSLTSCARLKYYSARVRP